MATRKPKRAVVKFPLELTSPQRESLIHATRLPRRLKERIREASGDRSAVAFNTTELESILQEVSTALDYVPPEDRARLATVLDNIQQIMGSRHTTAPPATQRAAPGGPTYQFKVTLEGTDPPIWRRIQVPDCTLESLHVILQIVMGWDDSHLHQFLIRGMYYGVPEPEYVSAGAEMRDEENLSIRKLVNMGPETRFTYEYDFGDSWNHEIVLEEKLEAEPGLAYPRCIEGQRACPPEDCGGVWGYVDLLAAIADPEHDEHMETKEWLGDEFDPAHFDLVAVNAALARWSEATARR
jgi:hypothetical protein